jgi:predicted amidophosphoribosyltransferase
MRELWLELRRELAGLVLPSACAGCEVPGVRGELCERCTGVLAGAVPRRVRPSPSPPGLPPVYGAMPYADEVRALLLAHKERGALRLAVPLGRLLAGAVRTASMQAAVPRASIQAPRAGRPGPGPDALTLVTVPSARCAVAGRGHDPVRRTALAAARELRREGVPVRVAAVLRQRRGVADQAGLSARQRAENVRGALELVPGGAGLLARAGGRTVLVDDLMTTGTSLAEAARAVAEGCGPVHAAAVVAFRARNGSGKR